MALAETKLGSVLEALLVSVPKPDALASHPAAAQGDYKALLKDVEARLVAAPDLVGERLLWVLAQLELAAIPVAALSGPLEEIIPKIAAEPEERRLAIFVLARFAKKLVERGQFRLALLILEQCREQLSRQTDANPSAERAVLEALCATYSEEIERAQIRKDKPAAIAILREKLNAANSTLSALRKAPAPTQKSSAPFKKRSQRSAKSILETAWEETQGQEAKSGISNDVPDWVHPLDRPFEMAPPLGSSDRAADELDPKRHSERLRFIRFGSAAIVLIGLYLAIRVSFPKTEHDEGITENLAMTIGSELNSSLKLPDPMDGVLPDSDRTLLKDLTRRLEGLRGNKQTPPGQVGEDASPPAETPPTAEGPREIAERTASTVQDVMRPRDRQKLPEMDTDKLSQTVLDNLGRVSETTGAGSDRPLIVGSDGRTYGGPLGSTDRSGSERALDGSPLQEYPVEQLNSPELYRVIAPTKVLSAPSVVAQALGELRRDSVIQVIARMGRWLEIRSTGGRRGFVYAQDAAPNGAP